MVNDAINLDNHCKYHRIADEFITDSQPSDHDLHSNEDREMLTLGITQD